MCRDRSTTRSSAAFTNAMPTYRHTYEDGRVCTPRMYPIGLMESFRVHFYGTWIPNRMVGYFAERDPSALPHVEKLLIEYQKQQVIEAPKKS
jgi:hypothetical protein